MKSNFVVMLGLSVASIAASVGCAGAEDEGDSSTGEAALTQQQARDCNRAAREYASQFALAGRRERQYRFAYDECVRQAEGAVTDTNELPLVRRRTRIASEIAARHLDRLPDAVKRAARCISVMSKDTIGWGLSGGGIGAGLVSCKTDDGSWSAPSYLSLLQVDIGPSIGFLDEDTTFVFTERDKYKAFQNDFDFEAGVFATAGSASVELSVDTDGCITFDLLERRQRNCTIAVSDRVGLAAGARVSAIAVRHMQGLFGGARVGRNARVYGPGITIDRILTTPGRDVGSDVIQPWVDTLSLGAR